MEAFLFSNLEALQTFWIFMEASLQRHYWSNHQPLVVDSISSSLPQPEIREWDWKFHLFFHGWFPWRPVPIPRYFPKSPHEYKPRCAGMGFIMNTETPISPFWLWSNVRIWGQRTILLTKDIPIACMAQEIPRGWGAMSQEPLIWRPYIWKTYFVHLNRQIHVPCKSQYWIFIFGCAGPLLLCFDLL